jgi:hypothetical protein
MRKCLVYGNMSRPGILFRQTKGDGNGQGQGTIPTITLPQPTENFSVRSRVKRALL